MTQFAAEGNPYHSTFTLNALCRGFARVQMLQRWQEISNSLKYLNLTEKELVQIYQTYLLKFEKNFFDGKHRNIQR